MKEREKIHTNKKNKSEKEQTTLSTQNESANQNYIKHKGTKCYQYILQNST